MICVLKKINTKTLSLLTTAKTIYSHIPFNSKLCPEAKVEKLIDENNSFEIIGCVSILNYLTESKFSASTLEHFFWVENSLVEKQEMKSVIFKVNYSLQENS